MLIWMWLLLASCMQAEIFSICSTLCLVWLGCKLCVSKNVINVIWQFNPEFWIIFQCLIWERSNGVIYFKCFMPKNHLEGKVMLFLLDWAVWLNCSLHRNVTQWLEADVTGEMLSLAGFLPQRTAVTFKSLNKNRAAVLHL